MATDERTQRPLGSATIISRRRFLKQTAFATAVVSVPYLGGSVAFGKENAKSADAALDRALKDLVAMEGGPPGVIAVIQRGQHREVHTFGVANVRTGRPMRIHDRMRIASTSKAFSGAVALSLVSKGALSLNDTIGELLSDLPKPPPDAWAEVTLGQLLNHTSGLPDYFEDRKIGRRTRRILEGRLEDDGSRGSEPQEACVRRRVWHPHFAGPFVRLLSQRRAAFAIRPAQPGQEHDLAGEHHFGGDGTVSGGRGLDHREDLRGIPGASPPSPTGGRAGIGHGQPARSQAEEGEGAD